jgi:hypothetical protein
LAHFAPRIEHDDEETVTRPLLRSQPFLLRAPLRTDRSIELEEMTEPNRILPDLACDEEWLTTKELPRLPRTPLVKRQAPRVALRPLSPPSRAPSPSRPCLPPVPAFTRPISVALPRPAPPGPVPRAESIVQLREDLRVDWAQMEALPTSPRLTAPQAHRPRLDTVRGLELSAMPIAAPEPPSIVIHPRAERRSELPLATEAKQRNPISEIPPCAFAALAPVAPPPASGLSALLRAARGDAWTAFLVLPIAVSLVSIVVLVVTALGSRTDAGGSANRRVVSATDPGGNLITDATVFVDGAARCQSLPCAFDLEKGTHWVSVSADGYHAPPARAVASDADGPRQIEFVLAQREAVAAVQAAPPMSFAPDAAAASAEPEPIPTPVVAPAPRTKPARKRAAAAPAVVTGIGSSGSALLNINSIPASNVVLDGRPLGRTPKIGVRVAPGAHTVVFIDGKRRVVRGTRVSAGKTAVVAARF